MYSGFTQAAVIFFREGLEVALMLSALAAYLVASNARDRVGFMYIGAAIGAIASIGLGLALQSIIADVPAHIFASILTLAGAAVMLYVSGWIWARRNTGGWSRFVKARAGEAVQTRYAIAALAFIVVLREGAEVVLFLGAVARGVGGWNSDMTSGIVAGGVVLAVVFVMVRVLSIRLPLRLVFSITSACLFLMALKFIGESLAELQECGLISGTIISDGHWLNAIGFNATWEAVTLQIMVIALAMTGFIALMRKRDTA